MRICSLHGTRLEEQYDREHGHYMSEPFIPVFVQFGQPMSCLVVFFSDLHVWSCSNRSNCQIRNCPSPMAGPSPQVIVPILSSKVQPGGSDAKGESTAI